MPLFGEKRDPAEEEAARARQQATDEAPRAMFDWVASAPPAELAVEVMAAFGPAGPGRDDLDMPIIGTAGHAIWQPLPHQSPRAVLAVAGVAGRCRPGSRIRAIRRTRASVGLTQVESGRSPTRSDAVTVPIV
jgi:hypothetical protein